MCSLVVCCAGRRQTDQCPSFWAAVGQTSGALLDQYWRSLVEAHPGYRLAPPLSAQHESVAPSLQQPSPHPPATSGIPADPHRPHKKAKAAVEADMQTVHRAPPAPP